MSKLSIAGLFVLAACFSVPVYAVGKITVDPNAGRAQLAEKTPVGADIAQKVTYEARQKTVVSILADLSEMTGVRLKAGYNNKDWQVRDRRMNIFAKDIPLASLMSSIARVMKFKWSKSDDYGAISYRLYMDREDLLGAERQRYIEEERLNKRQAEARQRFTSCLEQAAAMSESELEGLKTASPYVYLMQKQGWADFLQRLFAENPAAKQAWNSGEQLVIDISSLSADVRNLLKKVVTTNGIVGIGELLINTMRNEGGYSENIARVGDIGVRLPRFYPEGATAMIEGAYGFDDPYSEVGRLIGSAAVMEAGTPEEKAAMGKQLYEKRIQAEISSTTDLGEPLTEHPDDPDLSVKVKMKMEGDLFPDTLAALADCSSFTVVSDSFASKYRGLSFSQDEVELRAVLDKLGSTCHYNWERHNSILEFRDRDWFRKRAAQIPDAWLEGWRKAYKDKGFLDIYELSQIACLTPEQIWFNILTDEALRNVCLYMSFNQDFLTVYAGLSARQRNLILTKQGLPLNSLSGSQWSAVQAMLKNSFCSNETGDGLSLIGVRTQADNQFNYVFQIVTSDGEATGMRWKICCPQYKQPKEKPEDNKPEKPEAQISECP